MNHSAWQRSRLKYIVDVNTAVLPEGTDDDFEFVYIDIGNVSQGSMNVEGRPVLKFADAPSRARRLASAGDSVVSTVRTYLRAVATVPVSGEQLVFSTGFAVLSPRSDVHPRFLSWYLQGDEFVSRVEANSTGVSYPAITPTDLVSLDLWIPSRDGQRAIADYLDRETARIDTLIEEQERLIEMLHERRLAVIRHASEETDAPSVRLGWFVRVSSGEGINFHEVSRSDDSAGSIPVIGGNGQMGFGAKSNVWGPTLVVGRVGALCGNVHRVDSPAWITDNALRLDGLGDFDVDFLRWHLESRDLNGMSRSTAQPLITGSQVAALRVPQPTLNEQRRIAAYLDEETGKIDELIAETEQFIELSRERRAALVTAAVTGQIDVREAA